MTNFDRIWSCGHGMCELGVVPVDGLLELGVLGPQPGHLQLLLLAQVRHLFGLCPRTVGKAGERAARHHSLTRLNPERTRVSVRAMSSSRSCTCRTCAMRSLYTPTPREERAG